jgi:hypothetical protein
MKLLRPLLCVSVCVFVLVLRPSSFVPSYAQEMPDPSQIHGRALPAPELSDGTVTVRVVREAIGNDAPGQTVEVTVGNATQQGVTDEQGRATFSGLAAGEAVARVTVDGEALVSQPFPVPTKGGLRVILVAGMARAEARKKLEAEQAAAAPAVKGVVVLGENSRIILEFNNDALTAFYVLEIVNTARTRVDVGAPIVLELPDVAADASAMEGSSPQATVDGRRVTITGPFATGVTPVQFAFRLLYNTPTLTFTQTWPVALQRVTVGVEKVGALSIASPQFSDTGDVRAEAGAVYALGTGAAMQAGSTLSVTLSNLPVRPATSRYVAIGIVAIIVLAGAWLAWKSGDGRAAAQRALLQRREALLAELTKLDARRAAGAVLPDRQAKRHREVLAELEQIYGELDDASTGPAPTGDVAA